MFRKVPRADDKFSTEGTDDRPVPLFGRWRTAYLTVVVVFVLEVAVFYFVSRYFS
ncbi:MAG TPA: hypothetical protein VLI42_01385 [Chthoniobacterales bacterium]|nr:hypothetical protein [Chthoniobacterales bacterium]